ncbi:MAG: 5/3-nucleotidase [Actinomycetota bacterium]|jgi:5'/3'-nucleotidase SurE|nr:5/3-nucleotidase [Actinomycetota bacterium]
MAGRRGPRAILAGLLVLVALAGCSADPPQTAPGPLRILLVDDNGYTAPGVTALRDALRAAGHTVVQVSPLRDRSSSGTAVTAAPTPVLAGPPTGDPGLWAVDGTATDATLVGLRAVMGATPPDLVIVGVDPTPNVSLSAMHSGTVGAALAAAELGHPAIAVSTDLRDRPGPQPPAAFEPVASFVVRLVETLSRRPVGAPLLPLQTALNVNYPGDTGGGVVAEPVATLPTSVLTYRAGDRPGTLVAVNSPGDPGLPDTDVSALADGNVVLSDLTPSMDRTAPPPRTAVRVAPLLQP